MTHSERIFLFLTIGIWFCFAKINLSVPELINRSNDYFGHIEYTKIIMEQNRFPVPFEGWQTYHAPLYYMINSLFRPMGPEHNQQIRFLSSLYGAGILCAIFYLTGLATFSIWIRFVVTLFIVTTPAFASLFTHYNNDALVNLLSILWLALSARYVLDFSNTSHKRLFALYVIGVLGIYTKMTINLVFAISAIVIFLLALTNHLPWSRAFRYFVVQILIGISFLPWAIGHNYHLTGELTPQNCEELAEDQPLTRPPLEVFLRPPGFQRDELATPYAEPWLESPPARSYLRYLFSTSIFTELEYYLHSWVPWAIFWFHLFFAFFALRSSLSSGGAKISLLVIVLASLLSFPFLLRCPYRPTMNFRYIAWTWLPWGFLLANALQNTLRQKKTLSFILLMTCLVFSIFLHLKYMLVARY